MTKAKKLFVFVILVGLVVVMSGCTISFGSPASLSAGGGIWKSVDGGVTWEQKTALLNANGKVINIDPISVRRMAMDPQDHNTIYVTTESHGIFYTHDGAESWQQVKDFKSDTIRSLAIDPEFRCSLYVVKENKLFKSDDCGRFWKNIYFHQNSDVILTDVIIDHEDNSDIYIVTSSGEVVKSINGGQSWFTSHRADKGPFIDLLMDPYDSRVVYAATLDRGIYKTINSGLSWESLGAGLSSYSGSHVYRDLIIEQDATSSLLFISKFGMLRSQNAGESWEVVELVPAPKATTIYAMAIDPRDSDNIYYTTRDTLLKSTDGGVSWSSQSLSFSKASARMLVDSKNSNILYIGTTNN